MEYYQDQYADHLNLAGKCPVEVKLERQRSQERAREQQKLFDEAAKAVQIQLARQQMADNVNDDERWINYRSQWNKHSGDPFRCLGYSFASECVSLQELKRRFRALAKKYHPDKCNHRLAKSAFSAISEAFDVAKKYFPM